MRDEHVEEPVALTCDESCAFARYVEEAPTATGVDSDGLVLHSSLGQKPPGPLAHSVGNPGAGAES